MRRRRGSEGRHFLGGSVPAVSRRVYLLRIARGARNHAVIGSCMELGGRFVQVSGWSGASCACDGRPLTKGVAMTTCISHWTALHWHLRRFCWTGAALGDVARLPDVGPSAAELRDVMRALGVPDELAHTSIRFGISRFTKEWEMEKAADVIIAQVKRLRDISPLWEMKQQGIDLSTIKWSSH